jgi:hypothetical protein
MNEAVARELYELRYCEKMSLEHFITRLQRGQKLIAQNPVTDKLFVSRHYNPDDQVAINIALEYNQDLMVKLLMT